MLYTKSARRSRQFYDFSLSKLELDLVDPELCSDSEYETLRLKLKKVSLLSIQSITEHFVLQ